jgi:hypothetical protein
VDDLFRNHVPYFSSNGMLNLLECSFKNWRSAVLFPAPRGPLHAYDGGDSMSILYYRL